MKIVLTGRTGQVGGELQPVLGRVGTLLAPGRDRLDLAKPDSIHAFIREAKPDLIINAAAYTAVDRAEEDEELRYDRKLCSGVR